METKKEYDLIRKAGEKFKNNKITKINDLPRDVDSTSTISLTALQRAALDPMINIKSNLYHSASAPSLNVHTRNNNAHSNGNGKGRSSSDDDEDSIDISVISGKSDITSIGSYNNNNMTLNMTHADNKNYETISNKKNNMDKTIQFQSGYRSENSSITSSIITPIAAFKQTDNFVGSSKLSAKELVHRVRKEIANARDMKTQHTRHLL